MSAPPAGPWGPPDHPAPPHPTGTPPPPRPPGATSSDGYPEPYYAPGWTAPAPVAQRRRRTRLVVGVLVGVVLLGLVAAGAVRVNLWVQTRPVGTVDAPRSATAQQVRTGHCVQSLPDDGDVTRVRLVPCDEPHQAEVIGTLDLTGAGGSGTDWPGQEQVQRRVTASCEMASDQRELGLVAVVWSPTEAGWAQGDRAGLCLTAAPTGTVVGSFTAGQDVHR